MQKLPDIDMCEQYGHAHELEESDEIEGKKMLQENSHAALSGAVSAPEIPKTVTPTEIKGEDLPELEETKTTETTAFETTASTTTSTTTTTTAPVVTRNLDVRQAREEHDPDNNVFGIYVGLIACGVVGIVATGILVTRKVKYAQNMARNDRNNTEISIKQHQKPTKRSPNEGERPSFDSDRYHKDGKHETFGNDLKSASAVNDTLMEDIIIQVETSDNTGEDIQVC